MKNENRLSTISIIEVGVFRCERAVQFINIAKPFCSKVYYLGFDLFEDMTATMTKLEKSKVAPPFSLAEATKIIQGTGAECKLVKGNTRLTMKDVFSDARPDDPADLVFIDGGHSLDTIENDFKWCSKVMGRDTLFIMDDFYPDKLDSGCKKLLSELSREEFNWELIGPTDYFPETKVYVSLASVSRNHCVVPE
jgi:hypothetical protein